MHVRLNYRAKSRFEFTNVRQIYMPTFWTRPFRITFASDNIEEKSTYQSVLNAETVFKWRFEVQAVVAEDGGQVGRSSRGSHIQEERVATRWMTVGVVLTLGPGPARPTAVVTQILTSWRDDTESWGWSSTRAELASASCRYIHG